LMRSQKHWPLDHEAGHIISYIHQQIYIVQYKLHMSHRKLLRVLGSRCHPQGVTNTKENKHQHINLGSKMPSIRILQILQLWR
jgi:hypothetical protein